MPSVWPRSTWKDSPSTDFTSAVVGREVHAQVADVEERRRLASTGAGGAPRRSAHCRTRGSTTAYSRSTTRLARTTNTAATSVTPSTIGRSLARTASTASLPEPGQPERGLGEHRAAEQQAEVEAEDGEDRRQRAAQAVLDHDRALAQALRPGRADVVLVHGLQHARAGEPGVLGGEEQRERDPRQDQVVGPLRGVLGERCVAAAHRGDPPLVAKRDRASRPVQKIGSETPARAMIIANRSKKRAASQRGQHADRDAADHPEDRGADRQREGDGEPVEQLGADRLGC